MLCQISTPAEFNFSDFSGVPILRTDRDLVAELDSGEQTMNKNKTSTHQEAEMVVRLARETLALASVAGFVWMVCSVAHLVA